MQKSIRIAAGVLACAMSLTSLGAVSASAAKTNSNTVSVSNPSYPSDPGSPVDPGYPTDPGYPNPGTPDPGYPNNNQPTKTTKALFGTKNVPGWTMTTVFRLSNGAPATHPMAYIHLPKAAISNKRLDGIVLVETKSDGKKYVRRVLKRATKAPNEITNQNVKDTYNQVRNNYYFYYTTLTQNATIGKTYGLSSKWSLVPFFTNNNTGKRMYNLSAAKQLYRIRFVERKNAKLNSMGYKDITFYSF